jgi:hypothetical protein
LTLLSLPVSVELGGGRGCAFPPLPAIKEAECGVKQEGQHSLPTPTPWCQWVQSGSRAPSSLVPMRREEGGGGGETVGTALPTSSSLELRGAQQGDGFQPQRAATKWYKWCELLFTASFSDGNGPIASPAFVSSWS